MKKIQDERQFSQDGVRDAPTEHAASQRGPLDADVKDALVKRARGRKTSVQGVATSVFGSDRQDLAHALASRLPSYMVASWHHFWNSFGIFGISFDAYCIGRPLEETQNYALSDGEYAVWGAPQVAGT